MPRTNAALFAFNRGILSPKGLARVDLDRVRLSAEEQTNWIPRTLGSMTLRPGFGFIGTTLNNQPAYNIPFIFSSTDTSILEFTPNKLRIRSNDQLISRPAVTAAVVNGGFDTDLTGWVDEDEGAAVSSWAAGGYLSLVGTGNDSATRRQQVSVTEVNVVHSLSIKILRGPVSIRIGSSEGANDLMSFTAQAGSHNIAFTPNGDFWVEVSSSLLRESLVDSINVSSSGVVEIDTIYDAEDLPMLRPTQSADVVFIASTKRQQRVERRNNDSWSIVDYEALDGPFDVVNTTTTTITPSALSGNITLTASANIFSANQVGGLYRIDSSGQTVESSISAGNTFTDDIRVTGTAAGRSFSIEVSGTFTGTVTLQRSISEPGDWNDVQSYTAETTTSFDDGLDNQIIHYRIGIKSGDYTSGTVIVRLIYSGGTATGVARITEFTSETVVEAEVLNPLGSTNATDIWYEGLWSPKNGYPSACTLFEGRLWWAGKNYIYGSVSDSYASFDFDVEGDSGPIIRVIGFGPVDTINWLLSLQRIIAGTAGSEIAARSSSFDEPLTPTQFNLRDSSTQGSALVDAVQIDNRGMFVQRSGNRIIEMVYDGSIYEYQPADQMLLVPDLADAGIRRLGVQRQPDTRVHAVLNDGTALIYITDPAENVRAWIKVETDGLIEDVTVLPGVLEDAVYYVVNRDGSRCLERWALESECEGGNINKQADSFVQSAGKLISGLDHLNGKEVVAWADGVDIGRFIVSNGQVDLGNTYTDVIIGLFYEAIYKSSKLNYASGIGIALTQRKRITELALILYRTHAQGIRYGTELDRLDSLPREEGGRIVDKDFIHEMFDAPSFGIDGTFESDQRLYLVASAPRPCTVLGAIPTIVTYDKT